jgi:hypothetical protein
VVCHQGQPTSASMASGPVALVYAMSSSERSSIVPAKPRALLGAMVGVGGVEGSTQQFIGAMFLFHYYCVGAVAHWLGFGALRLASRSQSPNYAQHKCLPLIESSHAHPLLMAAQAPPPPAANMTFTVCMGMCLRPSHSLAMGGPAASPLRSFDVVPRSQSHLMAIGPAHSPLRGTMSIASRHSSTL